MMSILPLANDVAALHDAVLVHAGDDFLKLYGVEVFEEFVVAQGIANLLASP